MNADKLEKRLEEDFRYMDNGSASLRLRIFRVSELIDMLEYKKMELIENNSIKKALSPEDMLYVESIFMGLLPDSIVIDGAYSPWHIAQGEQAISALYRYYIGIEPRHLFSIAGTRYRVPDSGGTAPFADLPLRQRSRFLNCEIAATVINPESTDFFRLWVYYSSYIKEQKDDKFWKCLKHIFPEEYNYLESLSTSPHITDNHLIWQIMLAMVFSKKFDNAYPLRDPAYIDDMRYDLVEAMSLRYFKEIESELYYMIPDYMATISKIVKKVKRVLYENWWTSKKRTIFIILLTTAALKDRLPGSAMDFAKRFSLAWESRSPRTRGNLFRDYAELAKIIQKDIIP